MQGPETASGGRPDDGRRRKRYLLGPALLLLLAAAALAFRFPQLGERPMHADESVHALKFGELWEKGDYRYDPNEFHGPTLYYAALPVVRLLGRHTYADITEADYRLTIVLFGAGLLLLLWLLADGLGWPAALCAAVLFGLSPAFVFYSRYYIQETLLAFFTLGMLGCGWRYAVSRRPAWLLAAGLCAGLMLASKETAVLAFAAAGAALALPALLARRSKAPASGDAVCPSSHLPIPRHLAGAILVALATAFFFLSGNLRHPVAAFDYVRSFTPWMHRAGGQTLHVHPWNYYLGILLYSHPPRSPVWTEALSVGLALVALVVAFARPRALPAHVNPALVRFLALYTVFLTAIYSAIPYKTPWCLLSFLEGMILLAGVGAATLVTRAPGWPLKGIVALLLLAGAGHLGWQSCQANFSERYMLDNPYVYAHTVPDFLELANEIDGLAKVSPAGYQTVIKVFSVNNYYFPLPWYLRRFPNVGYWTEVPADANAPIVIASPEFEETLTKRLGATHQVPHSYGLRSGVFLEVWVEKGLWRKYLARPQRADE